MLGELVGAQIELEAQLAELARAGDESNLAARCFAQISTLSVLQNSIASANVATLAAMRSDVSAAVSAARVVTQQVQAATSTSSTADAAQLATTGAALRQELTEAREDLFTKRVFDPYLKFASPDDEAAYRRRESEARHYIDEQLAKKTPEGELNAAGATVGQMLDAHAHGAGDSPEFMPRWNRLVATTQSHREAMRANGRSTDEFDRNLASHIRRYLKDKGLTDAEIDAALAKSADPLDAVKPYVTNEREATRIQHAAQFAEDAGTSRPSASITSAVELRTPAPQHVDAPALEDVMATFRAAGVSVSTAPQDPTPPPGIGATIASGPVNQR